MSQTRRRAVHFAIAAAGGWLLWLVVAMWLGPAVIQAAYAERALPVLNDMFAGRDQHPVDRYLAAWRGLAVRASSALFAVTVLVGGAYIGWHRVRPALSGMTFRLAVPGRTGSGGFLLLAASIGLAAGTLEGVVRGVRHTVRGWPTGEFFPEQVWMSALAMALLLVLLALPLLAFRPGRGGRALGASLLLLVVVAAYGFVRSLGAVHPLAAATLATCAGVAVLRGVRGVQQPGRLARRATVGLTAVLAVWALAIVGLRSGREWRALAALPAAEAGATSVLLLILDTVRAQSLSLHGYERLTTPNLERFAADGAVFHSAWSPTAWTLPSHASVFTGVPAHELPSDYLVGLDDEHRTLAEVLADRGYATAGFVSNVFYASRLSGLARGFVHYEDFDVNVHTLAAAAWLPRTFRDRVRDHLSMHGHPTRKTAAAVNADFLRWLDARGDRPFFAFLNYLDAHDPYDPPEPFRSRFGGGTGRYHLSFDRAYTPEELSQLRNHYDGAIAYLDHEIGRLLAALDARGVLDETLVVITADHGEEFGEHGAQVVRHGRSLFAPGLHVPLAFVLPDRIPAGMAVDAPVAIANIPATILDLLGQGAALPGRSLSRHWVAARDGAPIAGDTVVSIATKNPREAFKEPIPISRGPMRSLRVDSLHLIVDGSGQRQLFDIRRDPWERQDLMPTAAAEPAVRRLLSMLDGITTVPIALRETANTSGRDRTR